ncbi:MAG TPA: HD domain-containing protein, partial [Anaeromyxobacteraceae bacterium]
VPVAEFTRALQRLEGMVGVVHLVAVEDQVFANEMRLRAEGRPGLPELGGELRRHNVGGMVFQSSLEDWQVRQMVAGLASAPAEPHPRTALQARLTAAGVSGLELQGVYRFRTSEDVEDGRVDPAAALRRALELSALAWESASTGRVFSPLPLRRAVVEMLEIGASGPALWDAWVTSFPRHEHALSVALHALLLGDALGLPRAVLQDLGVAALVHDVGYAVMGGDSALAGPEGLARHPGEGARALLRQRGFSDAKLRRLRAVLDHHRGHAEPRGTPSLVGSLLRLAEDYASFLRVYGTRVAAADVLSAMSLAAGSLYHPVLAQLFVNALGRYPPATLVELEDGRCARVTSPARSPETFATPLARLVDARSGALGDLVDLAGGPAIRRALAG